MEMKEIYIKHADITFVFFKAKLNNDDVMACYSFGWFGFSEPGESSIEWSKGPKRFPKDEHETHNYIQERCFDYAWEKVNSEDDFIYDEELKTYLVKLTKKLKVKYKKSLKKEAQLPERELKDEYVGYQSPADRFLATKKIEFVKLYETNRTPEEKRAAREWAFNHAINIRHARLLKGSKS